MFREKEIDTFFFPPLASFDSQIKTYWINIPGIVSPAALHYLSKINFISNSTKYAYNWPRTFLCLVTSSALGFDFSFILISFVNHY